MTKVSWSSVIPLMFLSTHKVYALNGKYEFDISEQFLRFRGLRRKRLAKIDLYGTENKKGDFGHGKQPNKF